MDKFSFQQLSALEWGEKHPQDILRAAMEEYGEHIAISFSGAEDVVVVDMAIKINPQVKVFSLDTGRLHAQTLQFIDKVRSHYNMRIDVMYPDHDMVEHLVAEKGLFSFYTDGHGECCHVRKVQPLERKLSTVDAWVTGQRRDQSPTRTDVPVVQLDPRFKGRGEQLVKFNPLANWTSQQVWEYIRAFDVPYNELHSQGFISIGCAPCTRQVHPGQHEREGRWWWEEATMKECGLHLADSSK